MQLLVFNFILNNSNFILQLVEKKNFLGYVRGIEEVVDNHVVCKEVKLLNSQNIM